MGEYGILLVDDEEEVRSAILRKIDWSGIGFGQVHDAENGQDALEKIEQYKPDVLLTDIRMPYMDGLKLCEQVRKKYPSMKLLIFSGFDDFEYAKQAIKLKVTEYILKPVNVEELSEILTRVKLGLDEEIRQRRDVDRLRSNFESSIPMLQEVFLNQVINGRLGEAETASGLDKYRINLKNARKWDVFVARAQKNDQPGSEDQRLLTLSAFLLDSLSTYYRLSVFRTGDMICGIVAIDDANTKTELLDLLNELCVESRRLLGFSVSAGIGHSCMELIQMERSYKSAIEALNYGEIKAPGCAFYINDITWEQENSAAKAVASAKKYIAAHYTDPELSADEICRYLCVSPNYFSTIFKKETGQTYIAYLTAVRLEKAVELLEHTQEKTYAISERVGYLDQNYFSYVFKKKYGMSPTKYRKSREDKA